MEKPDFDDFFCPLCKSKYDDNLFLPRMLPECGHTFCSSCLKRLLTQSDLGLTCPEDDIVYHNKRSILSFPKNFALLQIIEKQKGISNKSGTSFSELQSPVNFKKNPSMVHKLNKVKEELFSSDVDHDKESSSAESIRNLKKGLSPGLSPHKDQDRICLSHKKRMDLFCLDCRERICTNCALFGNHKSHEIEEEEEVLKRINVRAEKLLDILEKLESYDEETIGSFAEIGGIFELCLNKRSAFTTNIQEKFSDVLKVVQKVQENLIKRVNEHFNRLQGILTCLNKIPINEVLSGLETWKSEYFFKLITLKIVNRVKNKLLILSQKTEKDEISCEILEEKIRGLDVINEGNKLVSRLDKLSQVPVKLFRQSLEESKLSFNELLIKSIENNFFQLHLPNVWSSTNIDGIFNELMELTEELQSKNEIMSIEVECQDKRSSPLFELPKTPNSIDIIVKSPRKNPQKIHQDGSTSAYLSFNQNDLSCDSVKTVKRNLSTHNVKLDSININTNDVNYPENSNYYPIVKMTRKNHESQSRPTSLNNVHKKSYDSKQFNLNEEVSTPQLTKPTATVTRKHSIFEKNIMKKQSQLSKLKIPEKYKVIFEELRNDLVEQIDLSNADLGDKVMTHLADLLADSKNAKILKLKKNKITDEGFSVLNEAFRKNETLKNIMLDFNQLTEKSIENFTKMVANKKNALSIKRISFMNNNIVIGKCKAFIKEAKSREVEMYI